MWAMAARIERPVLDPRVADNPPSDADLCLRAREGDRRSFEVLVQRYQRPVYGLAVRLLGRPEEARDVAQEVFVKAFLNLDRYDPERAFAPWLLTIARNQVRDRARRRAVRKGDLAPDDPEQTLGRLADAAPDAEQSLVATQEGGRLEAALAALPEHYREVVVLHHVQERPVKEIAEILGRPQGTVMTWLYRARAALKDALAAEGVTR